MGCGGKGWIRGSRGKWSEFAPFLVQNIETFLARFAGNRLHIVPI
jgi:hypothetical protein